MWLHMYSWKIFLVSNSLIQPPPKLSRLDEKISIKEQHKFYRPECLFRNSDVTKLMKSWTKWNTSSAPTFWKFTPSPSPPPPPPLPRNLIGSQTPFFFQIPIDDKRRDTRFDILIEMLPNGNNVFEWKQVLEIKLIF